MFEQIKKCIFICNQKCTEKVNFKFERKQCKKNGLDQGHLHHELEFPRLTFSAGNRTRASAVGGEHSKKEAFELHVNSYSEHLHMIAQPVENARDRSIHANVRFKLRLKSWRGVCSCSCSKISLSPFSTNLLTPAPTVRPTRNSSSSSLCT